MDAPDDFAAILADARAQVAAGRTPDLRALKARVATVAERDRATGADVARAEREALRRLERVMSVDRARRALAAEPPAPPSPRRRPGKPLRAVLRTRPTITGNLGVRSDRSGGEPCLTWDGAPAVAEWEVRISERPDPRADYAVIETLTLPPDVRTVELPLRDRPLRVHVHGRRRDGRLVRHALISGLTRDSWADRWERRPTAS